MAGPNDAATLLIVLEANSKKLQNQLVAVSGQIDRFVAATTKKFEQMNAANAASFDKLGTQVNKSLGGITNAIGALGLGLGIKQVIDYANTWEVLQNKLASASSYSGLQLKSLEDLTDAASAARTPLTDYVTLYSRIATASGALHLTQIQIAETTDLVTKAFKISGSTASQQAGGIIEIVNAMDRGVVQGRQLRALAQDAPVIAQALAAYMKTTVGGLMALGTAGKIAGGDLIAATDAYKDKINTAFNSTQVTISDAVTKVENAFTEFVGSSGESSGAIQKLVQALGYLSDNFSKIAPVVADFAAVIGAALATKAVVGFAGALGEAVYALGAFLAAAATGEITMIGLSAAMGPLALLIGAAAAAFYIFNNQVDQVAAAIATLNDDIATNATKLGIAKDASVAYRQALRDQITTQLQAADAALAEANAQLQIAKGKASARALLPQATQNFYAGLDDASGNAFHTDPALEETAAMQQIKKAQAAVDALTKQQNASSWDDLRAPGTADQAKGNGDAPPPAGKDKGNAYKAAKDSIEKRTDVLKAETAAQAALNPLITDYGFAQDKAKASADLLSAAQASGRKITPDLKAKIDQLSTAYANAEVASKRLAESQQELVKDTEVWRDTIKSATSTFISDLENGKTAAEAMGGALTKVGDQLLSMGLDALMGGGSFGSKDSPFGLIGQLFMHANGGIASHGRPVPMFAGGGVSNSAAIFGEAGPEAAVPLPDGRRIPVDLRMPSSGGDALHVTYAPQIDAHGADTSAVLRLAQTLAQDKAEFEGRVISTIRSAKKQRKL